MSRSRVLDLRRARQQHAEHFRSGSHSPHEKARISTDNDSNLDLDPATYTPTMLGLRVFVGYSGWSSGQLEGELAAGGWLVLDLGADDPFCADPSKLWHRVLRRQGEGRDVRVHARGPVHELSPAETTEVGEVVRFWMLPS